jgi:hypothetical protein
VPNTELKAVATVAAVALGEINAAVQAGAPTAAAKDVLVATITQVAEVLASLKASTTAGSTPPTVASIQAAIAPLVTQVSTNAAALIAQSQLATQLASAATTTLASIVAAGWGDFEVCTGCGSSVTYQLGLSSAAPNLANHTNEVRWKYVDGVGQSNGTGPLAALSWSTNEWLAQPGNGWDYTSNTDGSFEAFNSYMKVKGTIVKLDVSNQPIKKYVPRFPAQLQLTNFPAGSEAYSASQGGTTVVDRFTLYDLAGTETSLAAYVANRQTDALTPPSQFGAGFYIDNVPHTFDGAYSEQGGVLTAWVNAQPHAAKATYRVVTKGANKMLVVTPSLQVPGIDPRSATRDLQVLTLYTGQIYHGSHTPAGSPINSAGESPSFNRTGLQVILTALGLGALPDSAPPAP